MHTYITRIAGTIPHAGVSVEVEPEGKNLLVSGLNGTGKTSFLEAVYKNTLRLAEGKRAPQVFKRTLGVKVANKSAFKRNFRDGEIIIRYYDTMSVHALHADILSCTSTSIISGVVFIDNIDRELDVREQRRVLPALVESFPHIQFVVSTRSPFVLMSARYTVIFDLTRRDTIREDLSCYTYSAVMKGLWDVKPISESLEKSIAEIARIVNDEDKDFMRLKKIINKIKGREHVLDDESKAFYLLGLEALDAAFLSTVQKTPRKKI